MVCDNRVHQFSVDALTENAHLRADLPSKSGLILIIGVLKQFLPNIKPLTPQNSKVDIACSWFANVTPSPAP